MAKEKRKINTYFVAFLIFMLIGFTYKMLFKSDVSGVVKREVENSTTASETTEMITEPTVIIHEVEMLDVYICGAVVSPGVYQIQKGAIVNDVVMLAGGMNNEAATEHINLVYKINDNLSIYIPREDEIETYNGEETIYRQTEEYIWGEGSNDNSTTDRLIDINNASQAELMTLPGIGESLAMAIIEYRTDNPFIRIEDLMNVSGIGTSKFNRIKDLVTVN